MNLCIQPSMNSSNPSFVTFSQFLSGLLSNIGIDIIINIAISDLSLYKSFNQNHPENRLSVIILTPGISLSISQSMAWRQHSGDPPSTEMRHIASATLKWERQTRPWKETPEWSLDMEVKSSGDWGHLILQIWGKVLQQMRLECKHMKERTGCKPCYD